MSWVRLSYSSYRIVLATFGLVSVLLLPFAGWTELYAFVATKYQQDTRKKHQGIMKKVL